MPWRKSVWTPPRNKWGELFKSSPQQLLFHEHTMSMNKGTNEAPKYHYKAIITEYGNA
jgi:hypothetical protein